MSFLSMNYCKLSVVIIKGLNLVWNTFWGFSQEVNSISIELADIDIDFKKCSVALNHVGNTEEDNNGSVVLKLNIHRSAGK